MASRPERAGVVRDATTGEMVIPASQRPDGTWRKPRRVKDGYIPQEEMPAFQTKGNQWSKSKPDHPIGLSRGDVEKLQKVKEAKIEASTNAAVRAKTAKQKEKQRQKAVEKPAPSVQSISKDVAAVNLSADEPVSKEISQEDINKKIRGLKKKLRQIEDLETKINSGEVTEPNIEQLDKVQKKQSVVDEINTLELKLDL